MAWWLRPFSAKTVTLDESPSDHSSDSRPHVIGDTLLDRQPANIYREASMARGNSPDNPGSQPKISLGRSSGQYKAPEHRRTSKRKREMRCD
jgi:hypothetical protein